MLLRHPGAVQLLPGRPIGAYTAAASLAERVLGLFTAAGFDGDTSARAVRTMGRFVVGSGLLEFGASQAPPAPREMPTIAGLIDAVQTDDPAALLTFGLETMIAGLEARLSQA